MQFYKDYMALQFPLQHQLKKIHRLATFDPNYGKYIQRMKNCNCSNRSNLFRSIVCGTRFVLTRYEIFSVYASTETK